MKLKVRGKAIRRRLRGRSARVVQLSRRVVDGVGCCCCEKKTRQKKPVKFADHRGERDGQQINAELVLTVAGNQAE